jgi:hypothetical protein
MSARLLGTIYSATGVPSVVPLATANPGLGRFLFAVFGIPFGLCMIVLTGSEVRQCHNAGMR